VHLGEFACRTHTVLEFGPGSERFTNSDDTNRVPIKL
jgi:hypothetical protein